MVERERAMRVEVNRRSDEAARHKQSGRGERNTSRGYTSTFSQPESLPPLPHHRDIHAPLSAPSTPLPRLFPNHLRVLSRPIPLHSLDGPTRAPATTLALAFSTPPHPTGELRRPSAMNLPSLPVPIASQPCIGCPRSLRTPPCDHRHSPPPHRARSNSATAAPLRSRKRSHRSHRRVKQGREAKEVLVRPRGKMRRRQQGREVKETLVKPRGKMGRG